MWSKYVPTLTLSAIGGGDLIEVDHPTPRSGLEDPRVSGRPVLHFGAVAAGCGVALDNQLRQEFAYKNDILALSLTRLWR